MQNTEETIGFLQTQLSGRPFCSLSGSKFSLECEYFLPAISQTRLFISEKKKEKNVRN
jgi:hypothetical protein